jgi:hypothetical protein
MTKNKGTDGIVRLKIVEIINKQGGGSQEKVQRKMSKSVMNG